MMPNSKYLALPPLEDTMIKEIEFDLDYFMAMSVEDRYKAAIELSLALIKMMEDHGHREPDSVLQRPAR